MRIGGSVGRAILWAPTKLYELGVRLRVAAYETGYLASRRLDAAVVSIGNITVGGTGKTPMVEYVARYLKQEGYSVAILTRGYGRDSQGLRVLNHPLKCERASLDPQANEFGDEPVMLSRVLPDIPIVVDKNRFEGGEFVVSKLGAQVLVLDDGFQHLALTRDLNLLLLDATDPFGGFQLAPLGRLREPLYGIKRADAVIVTRAHRPFDQAQLLGIVHYFCGDKVPVLYVYSVIPGLRHIATGEIYDAAEFQGWKCFVMCGIGNPRAFSEDLVQIGMNVVGEIFFRDHHRYRPEDFDRAAKEAQQAGADLIVTTEKDAVRLGCLNRAKAAGDIPLYAAQQEVQSEDEVRLKSLLLRTLVIKK